MFSHHITNKRLVEQTTHKLCIIKVHKGVKLQNNNININPIKSLNCVPIMGMNQNDLTDICKF